MAPQTASTALLMVKSCRPISQRLATIQSLFKTYSFYESGEECVSRTARQDERTNREIEAFLVDALCCLDVTVVLGQLHTLRGHHFEVITAIDSQRLTGDHVDGGFNQSLLLETDRCVDQRENESNYLNGSSELTFECVSILGRG